MPHMPTYEYFCETKGQTAALSHRISELLETWGELCQQNGSAAGPIPARSPIRRPLSAAPLLTGKGASAAPWAAKSAAGAACGGCAWPA